METILAIGTVALDSIETPFGKVEEILGGSGTHFAAAASCFAPVRLLANVGEDFPRKSLAFLEKRGVDLSGIQVSKGRSFRWSGRYSYDMNNRETLKTELGVLNDFKGEVPAAWRKNRHLFLGNTHPAIQGKVLDQVERPSVVSLDTMNFYIEGEPALLKKVMARVDLVIINQEEARQFSNRTSPVKAVQFIHALGVKAVVIKQGEYGALLFYKGEIFSAPGLPLEEVKDPTGAGDSFAGGLVGYLSRVDRFDFETLKKAVIVGSAMASFNVEDFGTDRLMDISTEEIRGRIAEFQRLGSFGKIEI
ncbi:MAG: sugar kinase [Deltaproteobacteria bacterium]|nr:sugar kinase [Deltaproteobacteria bacterium]